MFTARKNQKAFTLIELLTVVAILGTLATVTVLSFRGTLGRGEDTKRITELKQYQNLLEIYANKTGSSYINTNNNRVNISDSTRCELLTGSTTGCPSDPDPAATRQYYYRSNGNQYVLYVQLDKSRVASTTDYFVVCSDGRSDKHTAAPTNSNCPL